MFCAGIELATIAIKGLLVKWWRLLYCHFFIEDWLPNVSNLFSFIGSGSWGIHSTYGTWKNNWSRGNARRFMFGVTTCFLENQKKIKGTASGHSTSIVPSRDSKSRRSYILFGYFLFITLDT